MTPPARDQRGESLLEVLVAVTILSVVAVVVVGALQTAAAAPTVSRRLVAADAAITSAAERVVAAPYVPCARPTDYQAALATGTVNAVAYWDGAGAYRTTCDTDAGVQLVTVTVTDARGATATRQVAKRGGPR